jgi:N-acetyltransferase
MRLDVPPLSGRFVRLEPLDPRHLAGLAAAAADDRSTYGFTAVPCGEEAMEAYIHGLLSAQQAGETVPFAQISVADERPVGTTRYLTIRRRDEAAAPYAIEVGGTWLAAAAQGTAINPEAKLLLLAYAFDTWGVGRVDLKTDARNARSRAAIARLGATFEGVLRAWQPSQMEGEEDGLRDTAIYSILPAEWPAVRAGLHARLGIAADGQAGVG